MDKDLNTASRRLWRFIRYCFFMCLPITWPWTWWQIGQMLCLRFEYEMADEQATVGFQFRAVAEDVQ